MEIKLPHNWRPRDYQMPLWTYLEEGGKRACAVWHRRGGKDLVGINWASVAAFQRVGTYWHVFPTYAQGKKIIWDGKTKDGRAFTDAFPADLIKGKNHTEQKITLLNGSIYQVVGADKPDSLVGANPVGVIFSEWSLTAPYVWDLVQPILAENDGWAIFIYTPRGKNHGYKTYMKSRKNTKWFSQILPNSITRVVSPEAIVQMKEDGMPEEMIQQEMECSFEAPVTGSYYGGLITAARKENRIRQVPWEPRIPVHTAWDLGVADSTFIWFYQSIEAEIRLIDCYENSGEGLPHYISVLQKRPYVYGRHYAPHDIEVRELTSGKSRIETARSLGITFQVVKQHSLEDGIEASRNLLPRCWFDEDKCEHGIECLNQYHKEWDELKLVYKNKPDHDWSSHGADAFRILAFGERAHTKKNKKQEKAISEYSMFG